jgi:hypothetical protein
VSDGPEWFAPKRWGYGAGLPISWQGWAIVILYGALAFFVARFSTRPTIVFAILVPATTVFLVITAKTTRGGWRWRNGEDD